MALVVMGHGATLLLLLLPTLEDGPPIRLLLLLMVVGVAMTPVLLLPRAATGKLRDLIFKCSGYRTRDELLCCASCHLQLFLFSL
jgi:hypothetical protein